MRMEESAAGRGARTRALVRNPIVPRWSKPPRARSAQSQFSFWKKVRAKVTMSSQTETSAGVSEKSASSFGGLCGAGANLAMRVLANWEGGRKMQK